MTQPSATFMVDAGTGVYSFQARLEKDDGTSSSYSVPVSITVNP
jgi:hypothetical protein